MKNGYEEEWKMNISKMSNKELLQTIKSATIELENREYTKVMKEGFDAVVREVTKTPNQQRAELIQRAREFVEKYQAVRQGDFNHHIGNSTAQHHWYETEFVRKGTKITALIRWMSNGTDRQIKVRHVGRAVCAPDEVFNEWIGKAIALARALEIDIPVEFLQAVQPTEKVVGMVVEYEGKAVQIVPSDDYTADWNLFGTAHARSVVGRQGTLLDDTNAQYEEFTK